MQEIDLKLTIEETNLILEALGELSFKRVFNLIAKIQNQAGAQLGSNGEVVKASDKQEMDE